MHTRLPAHRVRRAYAHHAPVWLFDLDNTLHDSSRSIFKVIDGKMTQAVAQCLEVGFERADELRTAYWKRYGATVIGLVKHHRVDAREFLRISHDFDARPLVHSERGLARKFAQLPGRKVLLTNAPHDYARQVLQTLGILPWFDMIWSIDHMQLQGRIRPKPSRALMRQVLARLGTPASQVILVEDTLKNLKSARQTGMRTVHLFHPGTPFSALHSGRDTYVNLRINSLTQLLTGRRPLRR
ncbi:MAG: pyrimidine 5'-nucleotidase [Pusillimonas sp.]